MHRYSDYIVYTDNFPHASALAHLISLYCLHQLDHINALEDEEDEEAEKTYHQLSATKQKHAEEHAEDTSGDEFGSMSIDSDKAYQEHSITKSNSTTSTELVRIGHIW